MGNNSSSDSYGPRIFTPGIPVSEKKNIKIQEGLSRIEFVIGGAMLAMGGFALRSTGGYDLIVIGCSLIALAAVHLYLVSKKKLIKSRKSYSDDRILVRFRRELNADYSIAVDYPLDGDGRIDYLVVGPTGIFVIKKIQERGYVSGKSDSKHWEVESDKESSSSRRIENPLFKVDKHVKKIKSRLKAGSETLEKIQCRSAVVFTYHAVQGPVLSLQPVFSMESLVPFILNSEKNVDWEAINEAEKYLNFSSYSL